MTFREAYDAVRALAAGKGKYYMIEVSAAPAPGRDGDAMVSWKAYIADLGWTAGAPTADSMVESARRLGVGNGASALDDVGSP